MLNMLFRVLPQYSQRLWYALCIVYLQHDRKFCMCYVTELVIFLCYDNTFWLYLYTEAITDDFFVQRYTYNRRTYSIIRFMSIVGWF